MLIDSIAQFKAEICQEIDVYKNSVLPKCDNLENLKVQTFVLLQSLCSVVHPNYLIEYVHIEMP